MIWTMGKRVNRRVLVVEERGASRACGADAFIDPNPRHWDGVVAMYKEHQVVNKLSRTRVGLWKEGA